MVGAGGDDGWWSGGAAVCVGDDGAGAESQKGSSALSTTWNSGRTIVAGVGGSGEMAGEESGSLDERAAAGVGDDDVASFCRDESTVGASVWAWEAGGDSSCAMGPGATVC